ncbi:MAG: alpha/beta hydrolase [Burkholderiaceae bacterium]|jgi:HOMODA hydrolase|nr:alpha/beta hydrolase [Burkholderiaceae bacterium]
MSLWTDFLGAEIRPLHTPSFGPIRIARAGDPRSDALILLHGIGGHLEAYAKNVVALSAHYHVIACDFIGHGLSAKPTDIEYSIDAYVTQVRELMDALDIERAHISGESMGGAITGHFAVRYPERVKRIILNTSGGIPVVSDKGRQDAKTLAELTARNVGQPPTMESVRKRMQWLLYEGNWGLLTDELVGTRLRIYQSPEFQNSAPHVFGRLMKAASGGTGGGTPLIELEKLACETLLLWTRFNPIHDIAAAEAALPRIARGRLYVMQGDCAHWPQYECAEEFNQVVHRFLASGKA